MNDAFKEDFICLMNIATSHVRENNIAHQWPDREDGTMLMLIVSELGECLEALRHGNGPSEHIPEFSGAEEELADAFIRIMDLCGIHRWRLGAATVAKMEYNTTRSVRHGGKEF